MRIERIIVGILAWIAVILSNAMAVWGQTLPSDEKLSSDRTSLSDDTLPFGPAKHRIALGYLTDSSATELQNIPWQYLTHIAHAFLQADERGNLLRTQHIPSQQVTASAHLHNVRILLSLGGGRNVTVFEKITSNPAVRKTYADQIVSWVASYDYDGIDIDWEFPRNQESKRGFTALAELLRAGLDSLETRSNHGRHYELTATISGNEFFGQWLDDKALRKNFDQFHIMTYDMAGPWSRYAAHHAPLHPSETDPERHWRSVEASVMYWHRRRRIPKQKLCIGIPLYGRQFPVHRPFLPLDPTTKNEHKILSFRDLRELNRAGWTTKWDPDMKVPWLFAPNGQSIVAFDDRNSVREKATWARLQNLGGLYFWALGQDRMADGTCWLVREAIRAWPD